MESLLDLLGDARPVRILKGAQALQQAALIADLRRPEAFGNAQIAADYLSSRIGFAAVETVVLLLLDQDRRLLRDVTLSTGSASEALVPLREVARFLVHTPARAFVLAHNHPSGNPRPSTADIRMTRQIHALGESLEVPLVDHIIVARGRWISLRGEGLI